MKDFIAALFSEKGSISMMRLMSLICCIAAIVVAIAGISKPTVDYSGISILVGTFLGAAFGGKVLQKRIETKSAL